MIKITFTIVLLLTLLPYSAQAQTILRLFSTPAERADLERQRQSLYRPGAVPEIPEPVLDLDIELPEIIESAPVPDVIYRLGGSMQRSDGLYTVWINDLPINQEDLPDNMELLQPFAQGSLRISDPDSGASYDLKPGQVLNLTLGQLFESYDFEEPPPLTEAAASITESETQTDNLGAEVSQDNQAQPQ